MAARSSKPRRARYVVCVSNAGYPAALETRKIYRTLPDARASADGLLRVIDESGEDYLYPASRFLAVALAPRLVRALALAS